MPERVLPAERFRLLGGALTVALCSSWKEISTNAGPARIRIGHRLRTIPWPKMAAGKALRPMRGAPQSGYTR